MRPPLTPRFRVVFYRTPTGREPVREWLRGLDRQSKKILGEDIKTVQFAWPVGMPLVRCLGQGLWEVRSRLGPTIARVVFTIEGSTLVLLHAFTKKSRKTPILHLELARRRAAALRSPDR